LAAKQRLEERSGTSEACAAVRACVRTALFHCCTPRFLSARRESKNAFCAFFTAALALSPVAPATAIEFGARPLSLHSSTAARATQIYRFARFLTKRTCFAPLSMREAVARAKRSNARHRCAPNARSVPLLRASAGRQAAKQSGAQPNKWRTPAFSPALLLPRFSYGPTCRAARLKRLKNCPAAKFNGEPNGPLN
jgi:hypothetical protein